MAFWDSAWNAISEAGSWLGDNIGTPIGNAASGAVKWIGENKEAANIMGNVLNGVGGYFAQKELNKNLMNRYREELNMQERLRSEYSAVPDADTSYRNLVVDNAPNLANGGILTEMKKKAESKGL